ncbi:MAG: enoyl-CoA hydratase-related protein [Alphaproteobacteria bacterium]
MSVRFEVADRIARVTLDRPERMNAVDAATDRRLNAIWSEIEADRDIRCVVLTGAGDRAFCAGADMKAAVEDGTEKSGLEYWAEHRPNGFGGISLRSSLDVPVIARVNGVALGGGFEMVLGCDIVVAADHARLGLPEAAVGRLPLDGGMVLLPRLIPRAKAMGMMLTAARITAAEAERYGLVNEVVPLAELDAAVGRWTEAILACAPLSLKAIKQSVRRTAHLTPQEAHATRLPALIAALTSPDADEGVRAFVEKRKPVWQGR